MSTVLAARSPTSPSPTPAAMIMLAGGRLTAPGSREGKGGDVDTVETGAPAVDTAPAAVTGGPAAETTTVGSSPAGRAGNTAGSCTACTAAAAAVVAATSAAGAAGTGGTGGSGGDASASAAVPRPLPCNPMRHAISRSSSSTAR